jgi:transposase
MLTLPSSVHIYVSTLATDMRKGADGLSGLVMSVLRQEPQSGHVFVFFNKTRCIVRILFWDRDGYWLLSKRLERGRFRKLIPDGDPPRVAMSAQELMELLRGGQAKRLMPPPNMGPVLH